MDRQIIRLPFTRIDEKKKMVWGYASTGRFDTYDSSFDPAWWPQAIVGYKAIRTVSEMHLDVNGEPQIETGREPMIVGTVPIMECNERGLWIGAEITNQDTWQRIESGDYNGFSISAIPFESHNEMVNGRRMEIFTKYHLADITVGYPVANLDARFQLIERLEKDDSSPWDWDWKADADAIIDQLGWKGLEQACLYKDPEADPETKAAYKLPVAKLKGGKLTVYWNGVRAAMAVLNGARGGMEIPESARKKIYTKIKKLYSQFGKEAPELRLDMGGETMNTFVKAVVDLVKRLSGKDPDDQAIKEIGELETRLADEKIKQITDLSASVTALTERLEKLEKKDMTDKDTKDTAASVSVPPELTESITKLTERIAALEKSTATSKQPGETGAQTRTGEKEMFSGVFFT